MKAHSGSVENSGAHANERPILNRGRMDDSPVACMGKAPSMRETTLLDDSWAAHEMDLSSCRHSSLVGIGSCSLAGIKIMTRTADMR